MFPLANTPSKAQYGDAVDKITGELAATGSAVPLWVFIAVALFLILAGFGMWWAER